VTEPNEDWDWYNDCGPDCWCEDWVDDDDAETDENRNREGQAEV
jgi:hypothetical protein